MARPIALLTDFGLDDPYVGQLKGVLARKAPEARILDISHSIRPHDVGQAAFFLAASAPHFPDNTIFVAVVDPGVGTSRRILGVERREQIFLAPDNGLLSLVLDAEEADHTIYDLTETARRYEASATFHGRDIFAPIAARLTRGQHVSELGEPLEDAAIVRRKWTQPKLKDGKLYVHVLHVDGFGNCVLNLPQAEAEAHAFKGVLPPGCLFDYPLAAIDAYAELAQGEIGLMAGSQGYMELSLNQGSAAKTLNLDGGDMIALTLTEAE